MIDSTLYGVNIPAGTYTAGDRIPLAVIDGPAVVRSGRGSALLKRIIGGLLLSGSGVESFWRIHVKNSDWIDDAVVMSGSLDAPAFLDQHSGAVRIGNNTPLTQNSSWEVYAECILTVTTTGANSMFVLLDIDYPQVSAIADPDALIGIPASIKHDVTITMQAPGAIVGSAWDTTNVDILKAGYQYALQEYSIFSSTAGGTPRGFVKISNAAGMGGLSRIIPISALANNIRQTIQYATLLVKGPMDISYKIFGTSSTPSTQSIEAILDFVKRKV